MAEMHTAPPPSFTAPLSIDLLLCTGRMLLWPSCTTFLATRRVRSGRNAFRMSYQYYLVCRSRQPAPSRHFRGIFKVIFTFYICRCHVKLLFAQKMSAVGCCCWFETQRTSHWEDTTGAMLQFRATTRMPH